MKPAELFNPILHESPDFAQIDNREIQFTRKCHCNKPYSPDYYYTKNKKYCKYCVLQRQKLRLQGKIEKAKGGRPKKESICKCGAVGDDKFYWSVVKGVRKRSSGCKECRKQRYFQKKFK